MSSTTEKASNRNQAEAGAVAAGIVVSILLVLVLGAKHPQYLMWSIIGIGAITFFGMLMLANFLSNSPMLNKGEIRKAMAASILIVYFSLIAFVMCEDCVFVLDTDLAETIIGHFTYIVGIVVAFYFGSRAIEAWKGANPLGTSTTTTTTSFTPAETEPAKKKKNA